MPPMRNPNIIPNSTTLSIFVMAPNYDYGKYAIKKKKELDATPIEYLEAVEQARVEEEVITHQLPEIISPIKQHSTRTDLHIKQTKPFDEETSSISSNAVGTDLDPRFFGLDLGYYRKRIPPDQLRVLMDSVGIYPASYTFDPMNISYPEE